MAVLKNALLMTLLTLTLAGCSTSVTTFYYRMAAPPEGEGGNSFYRAPAADAEAAATASDAEVRNVIYLIGDGMGFNQVELARRYAAPTQRLWMDLLPVRGELRTRSANNDVTDSAAAGTAMACGIKTHNGMIGMNPDKVPYSSILELLDQKGWRTGLAATSTISHATPAAFSSHVDSRGKEREIALQQAGGGVDVMLAGGTKFWNHETYALAEKTGYTVVDSREDMLSHKSGAVIGLFAEDGLTTYDPEPMLSEMTATAIQLLSAKGSDWFAPEPKFFLMVEGSQIDWAGHANDTDRTVRQTLLFDMAVREALEFARRDGHTLVIVTADHETGGLKLEDDDKSPVGVKAKWTTGGHTGVNVPIYAFGPGAEKFAGTLDNTDIPKRIAELTGVGTFPVKKTAALQTAAANE
jgi:alkaline phosphatase